MLGEECTSRFSYCNFHLCTSSLAYCDPFDVSSELKLFAFSWSPLS